MSARYFRREWCGREWAVFEERLKPHGADRLQPIIWNRCTVPAFASSCQRTLNNGNQAALRDALEDYDRRGLRWLVQYREDPAYRVRYGLVVQAIAEQVVAAVNGGVLPPFDRDRARTVPPKFVAPAPLRQAITTQDLNDGADACAYFLPIVGVRSQIERSRTRSDHASRVP